jgi:hypothetical protein
MSVHNHEDLYLQYYEEIKEELPSLSDKTACELARAKVMSYLEDYGDYMADRAKDQEIDDAIDRGEEDTDKGDTNA